MCEKIVQENNQQSYFELFTELWIENSAKNKVIKILLELCNGKKVGLLLDELTSKGTDFKYINLENFISLDDCIDFPIYTCLVIEESKHKYSYFMFANF